LKTELEASLGVYLELGIVSAKIGAIVKLYQICHVVKKR
jgi:hypothetical protein